MAQSRRVVGEFDPRLSVADVLVADERKSCSVVVPAIIPVDSESHSNTRSTRVSNRVVVGGAL